MVLVTVGMATIRSWQVLPWLGALFGAGYGTFNALDFALAMDVLPGGDSHAAKDLGLWNLALALPMCLAAPVAGILLDRFNGPHHEGYTVLFAAATVYLLLGVLCVLKVRALK
jgi:MFS family permease